MADRRSSLTEIARELAAMRDRIDALNVPYDTELGQAAIDLTNAHHIVRKCAECEPRIVTFSRNDGQ